MKRNTVSIKTIAEEAGLSAATVSRVMNHPELVNPETIQLVRSTMERFHYASRRSPAKQGAAGGNRGAGAGSRLILINVPQLSNPFYGEIIRGIETSASNHQYRTLFSQDPLSTDADISAYLAFAKSVHVGGFILCGPLSSPEQYRRMGEEIPLVQCCEYNSEEFSYVSINDYRAAYSAMEHIYSCGRRKIAFINGPGTYKYAKERQRGYEEFLENTGLENPPGWCVNLPQIDYDMAYASACQLLTTGNLPDAIFASSDMIAAACIKAAQQNHIRVPLDLSIVGFDNINVSTITDPAITTVSQPCFQIGYTAGEILNEHMTSDVAYTQHILHNTELVIRKSSIPGSARPAAETEGEPVSDAV